MNDSLKSQIHKLATMDKAGDPKMMLKVIAILTAPDEVAKLADRGRRNVPTVDAPNNGKPWTDEDDEYILKHAHLPYAIIADGLGRRSDAVGVRARSLGVSKRTGDSTATIKVGRTTASAIRNTDAERQVTQ